ncbi:hypothetical protein COV93_01075 [Candidatus Woesearchaeota archaeon CG11_big_fil_rev_8_21_14_0_20_43_8]|nr:MAG: hypothetical protein COV93_01075 [Candidatus Woesearchaeota archaeon CG11_big_fil_rev_8_21_14_0_20_43_8]PIO04987.1 MAG: hypothetical protein COT47_06635 [Candidatus Woesearchaeota archaeon CG08_land_8_20_14_0_20_43_7]
MNIGRIGEDGGKPIKIDVKDKKILTFLENDSRMSLTQIAKKVALSRDAINYRIKRLVDKKIILRFFPELDFRKLGFHQYHVFMLLNEKNQEKKKEMLEELKKHPNITSIIEYSDRWDIRVVFIAKTIEEFDMMLSDFLSRYPDTILDRDTISVINEYCNTYLPNNYKNIKVDERPNRIEEEFSLDSKDMQILSALSKDSRVSTYEMTKEVDLSADAIGYRIKKMVASGVIKKFTILVNFSKLHYNWYTYGVQMSIFDSKTEAKFKEFCNKHPYILKSIKILGDWDILLFIVSDSFENFHQTIKELKLLFCESIQNYETWVAHKEHHFENFPDAIKEIASR